MPKSPTNAVTWSVRLDLDTAERVEALMHQLKSSKSQVCADLLTLILRGPDAVGPSARYLGDAMAHLNIDYRSNIELLSPDRAPTTLNERMRHLEAQIKAFHIARFKEAPSEDEVSRQMPDDDPDPETLF